MVDKMHEVVERSRVGGSLGGVAHSVVNYVRSLDISPSFLHPLSNAYLLR